MELDALIRALAPSEVTGARPVEIGDLAYDSRRVTKGALYFCVPGERVDGHDHAAIDDQQRPLHAEARVLLAEWEHVDLAHVRREENADADLLVNAALDAG